MWMRLIKRLMLVGVLLFVSLGSTAWWAHSQTQMVPEFYERAIALPKPADLVKSSEELEANVQQLQDDATQLGTWQAEFSVEQINAWLIEQLPKRFPTLRAKGVQDPRVMIEDNLVVVAARFKDPRLDAVLSCELGVQLTDQPNRLAISVHGIRAGALPLPLSQFKDRVKKIADKVNLNLSWETRDGETVALVDVPSQYPGRVDESIIIESIELSEQQLIVSGQTGDLQTAVFTPQGPIYEVASLDEASKFQAPLSVRNVQMDGGQIVGGDGDSAADRDAVDASGD